MRTVLNQSAGVWDSESGAFISESHRRLAEVLHDYNPYFSLVWIPPKDRSATDTKPFAILNSSPGYEPHIIRYLSETEMMDTTGILAWVFEGDMTKHRPIDVLQKIEARERADEILKLKQREDELEEIVELGSFIARTPLHTFKHNGRTYRE